MDVPIRTPFEEAAAAHAEAVDAVYGERLRWLPQAEGGDFALGGADAARSPVDFTGAVTRRPQVTHRGGRGAQDAHGVRLVTARWQVSCSPDLGLALRAGDLVVRRDKPGQPRLRLGAPEPIPGRIVHPADQVS